ncbi:hypothetical protein SAMN05660420_03331 [Desulfuromusa kysingii]|uniref:Uncharacterized protein n=1 Tax=Desulfuromusa kysingii TaxID=37625 RepID=A0A1H4EDJ4_9BACT|nr:hypothetical protein [Desulfuromusa kysingii]SEA82897.1 hypothetical protein SAMN05660420_03331 [Desulfuromusa kysingii]
MIYFGTKKDKMTVEAFLPLVVEFWEIEVRTNGQRSRPNEGDPERYQELREEIARKTPSIIHISRRAGIPDVLHSYPAPAVGGPVIPVNIYESILQDDSHGHIPNQRKLDTINKLIGQLEGKIEFEFKKAVNPFFWFGVLLEKILRIPFWLLSKTGFEISKVEDHFLGKLFKLIEIVALLYISLRLGIPDEWVTTLLGGVGK